MTEHMYIQIHQALLNKHITQLTIDNKVYPIVRENHNRYIKIDDLIIMHRPNHPASDAMGVKFSEAVGRDAWIYITNNKVINLC